MKYTTIILSILVSSIHQAGATLVAHFRMDGNANDSSSNANHGTLSGAVATSDRFANNNSALFFDGTNDSVDSSQLLFNGDNATVAFWAQSAGSQSTFAIMVSQGHSGNDPFADTGFAFQYGHPSSNVTSFISGNNTGGSDSWSTLNYGIDLESDTDWHHYAMTYNGATTTIYLDGTEVASSNTGLVFNTYAFSIGHDTFNPGRFFHGSIDDVQVYDNPLTGAQVLQLTLVPEPTSTSLLLLGGAALILRRRKSTK